LQASGQHSGCATGITITARALAHAAPAKAPWHHAVARPEILMSATSLIIFLLIGSIAGWLAGLIVRGFGFGLLGNIVVGIVGALIAGWLLPALGIGFSLGNAIVTSIVYAMIGAIVLLVLIGLIRRA
jgi:uncharacterized membrane protein YeaQ/YmgE (transglycosylase-associated protein family)